MLYNSQEAREMQSRHSTWIRTVSIAATCALAMAGCTQTYVYSSARMPTIKAGHLIVRDLERSHGTTNSFEIDRVALRDAASPNFLRAPTDLELDTLLSGGTLDNHIIELDVDSTRTHWRDHGLAGAGLGVSLGILSTLSRDNNNLFGDSQLGLLLVSVMLGSMGFLAGIIGGTLSAPDFVDMRHTQEFGPR